MKLEGTLLRPPTWPASLRMSARAYPAENPPTP
jgi:hypothetical protein